MLLSLFSGITAGCQTRQSLAAVPCEQPQLRGPSWADVAILSVEQKSAIDICNIRNGVDMHSRATVPTPMGPPTPAECVGVGVKVPAGRAPSGVIISERQVPVGTAASRCGMDDPRTVGCSWRVRGNKWNVIHEGDGWVKLHEWCHATYQTLDHTMDYLSRRQ